MIREMKKLLKDYRKAINPPYLKTDVPIISATLLILLLAVILILNLPDVFNSKKITESHAAVDCGTSLQTKIDGALSGSTVDLTGCTYSGTNIQISKPLTIIGGSFNSTSTDRWSNAFVINSDNVTVQKWTFAGGGQIIADLGHSNVNILNNSFSNQLGSSVALWGASNNVIIDGNKIVQSVTNQVSPIIARASEDCSVYLKNLIIRNNYMDQGPAGVGWFGIELKCNDGVLIENNTLHGGETLVSLPDTNNVQVKNNTFDMTGDAYWGVEIAHANNVTVAGNTFFGDGPSGTDHAVSENSGSQNSYISGNNVHDIRTLVDVGGDYISITDNCLVNVLRVTEYDSSGTHVILSNNGPCPSPSVTPTGVITTPSTTPTPAPTVTAFPTPAPTVTSNDTTSPSVRIDSPLNGSIIKAKSTTSITASASDNLGVTRVEFLVNGTLICSDTTSPYTCSWRVPGSRNRTYTISAKAYDAAGNNSTSSISVTAK